jgi:hypothetical protein
MTNLGEPGTQKPPEEKYHEDVIFTELYTPSAILNNTYF